MQDALAPRESAVEQQLARFRTLARAYADGSLDPEDFRPERLRWGIFFQGRQTMLRIALPGARVSAEQLRCLAAVQARLGAGDAHLTTRQNIQLYGVPVRELPAVLDEFAGVGLYTLQTSGPCVRKIALDDLAGVGIDENDDPWPWWVLLQRWATLHPELGNLPRKLKVALSAASRDRVGIRMHDVGLQLSGGSGIDARFDVWVGGGLGRRPRLAERLFADLPGRDLLPHLEALLRLYDREGQRHDKQRARLKDFVRGYGLDALRRGVQQERASLGRTGLEVGAERLAEAARAAPHAGLPEAPVSGEGTLEQWAQAEPAFAEWLRWNTEPQRPAGVRAVTVCLAGRSKPPGDLDATEMALLAELAEGASGGELRLSPQQRLLLPHVPLDRLYGLWQRLRASGLAEPVAGTLADPVSCPGQARCELASVSTGDVAVAIRQRLERTGLAGEAGPARLAVGGCMNACSRAPLSEIGLRGVEKAGGAWYQLQIGGQGEGELALARTLGPAVPRERVPAVVAAVVSRYLRLRSGPEESLGRVVAREGVAAFRDCLEAADTPAVGVAESPQDLTSADV